MRFHSAVELTASDTRLVEGFEWAKAQALAYVFSGDPVGDWYEASLPGREAFCMRDVAHQSTGAQILGLAGHTRNMLWKFAENIAPTRDWCTYWEIDRHNRPAPVDYRSDQDFWYNLPANFDLLDCCYRQYLWSGDRTYLDHPVFRNFYAKTVNEYVQAWDKDGDGIPEHYPHYGQRGIATYNEEVTHPLIGGDLIATQCAAYAAYATMLAWEGAHQRAADWRQRAQHLRHLYSNEWWSAPTQCFASYRLQDGSFAFGTSGVTNYFPLYFGLVDDEAKAGAALEREIQARTQRNVEERSYLPELFYAYGRDEMAYTDLLEQMSPTYARRDYPEVAYAVIGTLAVGTLGIAPDANTQTVTTLSHLTAASGWVEMLHIPVFANQVRVKHIGHHTTEFSNEAGAALFWRATFPGHFATLLVDGKAQPAQQGTNLHGQAESWAVLTVAEGASHTVRTT